jgi:uncharacterized damage-inducible protein DinB
MTTLTELLLKEFDQETATTRKMLAIVPEDKYDWKPHEKSMTIRRLVTHIADLPSWIELGIYDDGLDFATTDHKEPVINNNKELLAFLEESITKGRTALAGIEPEQYDEKWTLSNDGHIISEITKAEIIRISFSQTTHHRAQLGVYLRLLNIPIPGSYGPSADELGL